MAFIGSRPRTREILQTRMYTNEIYEWLAEVKLAETHDASGTVSSYEEVEQNLGSLDPEQLILNGLSNTRQRTASNNPL